MKSRLVEFYRSGKLDKGLLRAGDEYLVSQGSEPVCPFEMTLDHDDYLDLVKALSYKTQAAERTAALKSIAGVVTAMLKSDTLALTPGAEPLQLDLVVNAAELGALQFEAACAADGRPLLARDDVTVTLTRRVRGAAAGQRARWPVTPRVLFVWASPPGAGDEVPHGEHLALLRDVLAPWIGPQPGATEKVLTVLEQATLATLEQTLKDAAASARPYTHVHILAHGYPIGNDHRKTFGLALHDANLELVAVEPEALVDAMAPLRATAAVVTLAACDSGNESNTLVARKSLAHQLHVSGIPIVVASQYPLTMAGSNLLVSALYPALLAGEDMRLALHQARVALWKNQDLAYHDWVSLVCYASLPEAYDDVLAEIGLQRTLAALKTAQAWSDDLVNKGVDDPAEFARVESRLRAAIDQLQARLDASRGARHEVLHENLGLLGSAEKRLAELYFHRSGTDPQGGWLSTMHEALQRSRAWYLKAARRNLSQHWQAVQALSLEAVLTGTIAMPGLWHAAVTAARIAKEDDGDHWAAGSLAELYLLAPYAGQPRMADAAAAELKDMVRRLDRLPPGHGDRSFAPESMRRQLQRYERWWTRDQGYFPAQPDLKAEAKALNDLPWGTG